MNEWYRGQVAVMARRPYCIIADRLAEVVAASGCHSG